MNPSGKFIQEKELTISDIGSKVIYVPKHVNGDSNHYDCEPGTIVKWKEDGVIVQYNRNKCRTDFSNLVWN